MAHSRGNRETARISVSFDGQAYGALSSLANEQDVSVARPVRRAVHDLIARQDKTADTALPLKPRVVGNGRSPS